MILVFKGSQFNVKYVSDSFLDKIHIFPDIFLTDYLCKRANNASLLYSEKNPSLMETIPDYHPTPYLSP